jgi:hypothetical protein
MIGRRRPLARAAMVGGAGYMAGRSAANRNAREQEQEARIAELEAQQQYAQPAAAPPPPPPAAAPPPPPPAAAAPAGDDMVAKLTQLAQLKDQGILSEDEFNAAKAKLLSQ